MYDSFHGKDLWIDPIDDEAKKGAVLLSDQIAYYVEKVNMISPFKPEEIRPASYLLHVGSEYYVEETRYHLNEGDEITIPENGLVYIQTHEWLNIPYYLIARYNLEVKQLYRGFLLDDGLQIDPGYHGHFYCPIHNLTNQGKKLKRGNPFIVIDFVRTSPFKATNNIDLNSITDEQDLLDQNILGISGNPINLFAKDRKNLLFQDRTVHDYWIDGEKHGSSMQELQVNLERLEKKGFPEYKEEINSQFEKTKSQVVSLRKFAFIGVIAVVIAAFGIIMPHLYWQEGKFSAINSKYEQVKDELAEKVLTHVKKEATKQLDFTKNEIVVINESLEDISNRQDISQESIKAIQNTLVKFENLFKQMEVDSRKNPKALNAIDVEISSKVSENIQGKK